MSHNPHVTLKPNKNEQRSDLEGNKLYFENAA